MRTAGELMFTDEIGGQSRRETVASQIPRTGSLLCWGLLTGGCEVVLGPGGCEEQLPSNNILPTSTANHFMLVSGSLARERARIFASFF